MQWVYPPKKIYKYKKEGKNGKEKKKDADMKSNADYYTVIEFREILPFESSLIAGWLKLKLLSIIFEEENIAIWNVLISVLPRAKSLAAFIRMIFINSSPFQTKNP